MKSRKPLFQPPDPLAPEIAAMRIRIGGKHKPALDYVRARESLREIRITSPDQGRVYVDGQYKQAEKAVVKSV